MSQPKPPRPATKKPPALYQLKITLLDTKPPIWRRIVLLSNTDLGTLHQIIQRVMGWGNGHLHEFQVGSERFGELGPDLDYDRPKDQSRYTLAQTLPSLKARMVYTYDFGDNWEHLIELEKVLAPEAGQVYPLCVAGKRAGPPEDCGGVWGYQELIGIMANPKHPEHKEMKSWLGGPLEPEHFDLEEINQSLKSLQSKWA